MSAEASLDSAFVSAAAVSAFVSGAAVVAAVVAAAVGALCPEEPQPAIMAAASTQLITIPHFFLIRNSPFFI